MPFSNKNFTNNFCEIKISLWWRKRFKRARVFDIITIMQFTYSNRVQFETRSDLETRQAELGEIREFSGTNGNAAWSRRKQNLIAAYTRGLLRIAICQEVGGQIRGRRFESSLFAVAAAYPWIREFSENHAQTPFTISPLDFEYWGWIIPPSDSCASLLHSHRTIVGWMDGSRYVVYVVFTSWQFDLLVSFEGYIFPWMIISLSFSVLNCNDCVFLEKKISGFWNRCFRRRANRDKFNLRSIRYT